MLGQMLLALAVFGALALVLLFAGLGKIFKAPPEDNGNGFSGLDADDAAAGAAPRL